MKAFVIFLVGAALAIAGLTWAMIQLGVPANWVVIVDLIIFGASIASGAGLTKPWADNTEINVRSD